MSLIGKLPKEAAEALKNAKRPAVIVGGAVLNVKGAHGDALALAEKYNLVRDVDGEAWNGFNVLHFSAARMGGLMLGFAQKGGIKDIVAAKPKLLFALGADEMNFADFADSFKVFIGHHGDNGAHHADVILPASAYTEKNGTYVNLEGRVQHSDKAAFAPGDAREDWSILRALSDVLGHKLPFDSFAECRAAMVADVPALGQHGLVDYGWDVPKLETGASGEITYPIKDFYLTNAIARASQTMQRCSAELLHGAQEMEAAE